MKRFTISLFMLGMTLTAHAQVGVNTTNPRGIFNVDGAKNNTTTTVPATIATESKDDVVVTTDGNVGIGTSNPSLKLEIQTGGTSTTPIAGVKLVDGTQQAGRVLTSDANGVGTWQALSIGNKTSIITWSGSQAISTTDFSLEDVPYTINSDEIGLTATNSKLNFPAGKYMVFISHDLAAGEYTHFRVIRSTDNAEVFNSYYGEWLNCSFLLDMPTAGSISFYIKGLVGGLNPSSSYYLTASAYSNIGIVNRVTVLKLN